jgi:homoserine O-succinyltransferase/O-acetyltransferase
MPLISHNTLPTFARLRAEGVDIVPSSAAPDLRIGFLNMLLDGALQPTERQFLRLLAGHQNIVVQVLPFSLEGPPCNESSRIHLDTYYSTFPDLRDMDMDALIVTGINIADPRLENLPYLDSIFEILDWASAGLKSSIYSCLATHAVMQFRFNRKRSPLPDKHWGVYPQRIRQPEHPLCRGLGETMDVPHSRWNDISPDQFTAADLDILIDDDQGCVSMACSRDGLREIYLQGHPEYDAISLLKEYKRELSLHADGTRADAPPIPRNILPPDGARILADGGVQALESLMRETWLTQTKTIFGNWLEKLA